MRLQNKSHNKKSVIENSFDNAFRWARTTRTILYTIFILILASSTIMAKDNDMCTWNYEISCVGFSEGHYVVEVSAYVSKKKDITAETIKKCALHGVLFKGLSGDIPQRPIIKELQDSHYSYIEELLNNSYGKYTETIGIPLQVIKQDKIYKVTTTIQVSKDLLRKDLEKAGVIRKLGF